MFLGVSARKLNKLALLSEGKAVVTPKVTAPATSKIFAPEAAISRSDMVGVVGLRHVAGAGSPAATNVDCSPRVEGTADGMNAIPVPCTFIASKSHCFSITSPMFQEVVSKRGSERDAREMMGEGWLRSTWDHLV